jgi:hypothetical protein
MPPGVGLGGTGGLATPSRHFEQAYLGRTWTRTSSRDELELVGLVLADAGLGGAAAGAGLLRFGEVVLDADVGEVLEAGASRGASRARARCRQVVVRGGRQRSRSRLGLGLGGEVEEMSLIRVVGASLAARSEEVAAEQGQRLEQLGVLLLEVVIVLGSRREDAFQFVDAAAGVVGPLLFGLGPLPQRIVAAEQVREEPPALGRIIGSVRCQVHGTDYIRTSMLCKSFSDEFSWFFVGTAARPAGRNRWRRRAVFRSMPERIMASCAASSSMPSRSPASGTWKPPTSSRLYQMAKPS